MTDSIVGIQSMDCVQAGDWLVVNRGPLAYKKENGNMKSFYPPEYEGLLLNVLAVSPPLMLVRFFPFPGHHTGTQSITTAWHWERQRYSRATESYIDTYLELAGFNRDGTRRKALPGASKPKAKRRMTKRVLVDGKLAENGGDNNE